MGVGWLSLIVATPKGRVPQSNPSPTSYLKRSQFRCRSQEPKPPILTLKTKEPANTGKYKPDHQTPVHEPTLITIKILQ
jgi:hypothetical protein